MKKFKILTALITTLVIVMTFCLPVFAADSFTIKITKKDDAAHTYEAYQIFTGTVGGEDLLTNVQWGSSIAEANQADFLTGIQALTFGTATPFSACTSAADVATVLCEADDADKEALAATFAAYIGSSNLLAATPTASVDIAADETDGTMTVSSPGYYFIRDKKNTLEGSIGAYTEFILKVCANVDLESKSDVPTLDKNIIQDTAKVKAATVSIGDYVKYQLDSVVPNMDGYNRYYFNIHDTMSAGLTFCEEDTTHPLTITIGTKTLVVDTDYTVTSTTDANGITELTIVLKEFYNNYKDAAGQAITVTYFAQVNEDASLTTDPANMNDAYLVFSNDPNYDYDGTKNPDTPDTPPEPSTPGDTPITPTGKTPESKTVVYTTGIQVIKVDKNTKNLLNGATFELAGTGVKTTLTFTMKFTENAAGTFYQLADEDGTATGKYTQLAPTDETLAKYVQDSGAAVKYIAELDSKTANTSTDTKQELVMTETGILTVYGLNAGEYTLTEKTAPTGYNALAEPISIEIAGTPSLTGCTWTATVDDVDVPFNAENYLPITIENSKGAVLPATGGIGTTILYVLGSILMIGAGVVLVTKKRVEMKKK